MFPGRFLSCYVNLFGCAALIKGSSDYFTIREIVNLIQAEFRLAHALKNTFEESKRKMMNQVLDFHPKIIFAAKKIAKMLQHHSTFRMQFLQMTS